MLLFKVALRSESKLAVLEAQRTEGERQWDPRCVFGLYCKGERRP